MRHGFPLHRNLRPVFVSFHCNKRNLLTPDAVAYLKRYGPVGCRDWTTVDLLLSLGVPAFFSGCLTTTIDTVFPALAAPPPADAPPAYVDVPEDAVPPGAVTYKHSSDAVRRRPFVENVQIALDRLETYRREHARTVTSRLHCFLPLRSIGAPAEFVPKNPADVRFDGLIGISDAEFDAMRDALLGTLEAVFAAILSGRPEEDVYALWRALTADDVAAAEARRAAVPPPLPAPPDRGEAIARALAGTETRGEPAAEAIDCAVILPPGKPRGLPVLIASLLEHASRPVHLWLLARPGAPGIEAAEAERFPGLCVSRVPVDGLVAELRLLLGELLPTAERVVLLPLPALVSADVAELAGLELGRHGLAAPRRPGTLGASGFGVIHGAAARLADRPQDAARLRRMAHARHAFDFDAFSVDVLVADLARWRAERFGEQARALRAAFGLDPMEALHVLVGPERATVPERWAAVPTRTPERGPGLQYWADGVKPWQAELTPGRERWRHSAAVLAAAAPAAAPSAP
jgi:hypothetical protein